MLKGSRASRLGAARASRRATTLRLFWQYDIGQFTFRYVVYIIFVAVVGNVFTFVNLFDNDFFGWFAERQDQ